MRTLEFPLSKSVDSPKTLKVNEHIRISFACGLFFVMSNAAPAATIVDQQYVPYPSQSIVARAIDYNGQSFTAGQWGILKRIEIWVKRDLNVTNDMDWTLFRFNGDAVQQPYLAELTIPNSAIPTAFDPSSPSLLSIDLSKMNIVVSPGDYLGMVVHSQIPFNSPSGIFWFAGCNGNLSTTCGNPGTSDGYARGFRLQSSGIGGFGLAGIDDLAFRTYVELAEPPVILTQPQSQITSLGSNVTFRVLASGTPQPRYQWRFNGADISGATNSTLVITNVQLTDVGNYTVEVTNLFGSITSSPVTLAFNAPPVPPAFEWIRQGGGPAGGSNYSQGQSIAVDFDGNCFVTGQFGGTATFGGTNLTSIGRFDIYVAKYDKTGVLQWVHAAGSTNSVGDGSAAIAVDENGNCYVTGYFGGTANFGLTNLASAGAWDIFIAKYTALGTLEWVQGAGGSADDQAAGIALDGAGNIYVTGGIRGSASFGSIDIISTTDNFFLAKYNNSGLAQWVRTAAGGTAFSVAVDRSGNSFIPGFFWRDVDFGSTNVMTTSAFGDAFLAKYDSSGVLQWVRQARSTDSATGYDVALDGTGKCYWTGGFGRDPGGNITLGNTTLYTTGGGDIFVAKYDGDGTCEWARQAGGNNHDSAYGIAVDALGSCYVLDHLEIPPRSGTSL